MDKERLTQEELFHQLDEMTGRRYMDFPWSIKDRQAYNQIKVIVEEHFRRKDFTKGHEIKQIQQKLTVTREWVKMFMRDVPIMDLDWRITYAIGKLKELGVGIEE